MKGYFVGPIRLAVIPVFLLGIEAVLLTGALIADSPRERFALLATAATTFCIIFPWIFVVGYTRLFLTPAGLELRQLGYRLRTTWDNIQEIRLDRFCEGLVLRHPLEGGGRLALKAGLLLPGWYRGWQAEKVRSGLWIPLDPFAWHLRHGNLLEEMRRFAPELTSLES
jgi:hypothetical protein